MNKVLHLLFSVQDVNMCFCIVLLLSCRQPELNVTCDYCSKSHGILCISGDRSDESDYNIQGRDYSDIHNNNGSRMGSMDASMMGNIPSTRRNAILCNKDYI